MSVAPYIPIDKPAPRQKHAPKFIKRGPFKRHGPKSARKVQQLRDWNAEKDRAWIACRGQCVAKLLGCGGRATEPHHYRKRSLGGHANPRCLWLCAACHSFCERNPKIAAALGLVDLRKAS